MSFHSVPTKNAAPIPKRLLRNHRLDSLERALARGVSEHGRPSTARHSPMSGTGRKGGEASHGGGRRRAADIPDTTTPRPI